MASVVCFRVTVVGRDGLTLGLEKTGAEQL